MKKIINILITLSLLLSCMIIPARAGNDISVTLNGEKIYFDQPPIIQNGRTLVPMRAIFEAMGCRVEWDDGVIDVWDNDENIMTLWVDDTEMWTQENGYIYLDVPPQIINDRTLVPVRAISESIGATVEWNGRTRMVIIEYDYQTEEETIYSRSLEASYFNLDYDVTMEVGEEQDVIWDSDVSIASDEIEFYSDNEDIAIIDDVGTITAISDGKTQLHANWGRFNSTFDMIVYADKEYDDYTEQTDNDYVETGQTSSFNNLSHIDYDSTIGSSFFNIDGYVIDIGDNKHNDGILFKLVNSGKINFKAVAASLTVKYDLQGDYTSLSGYICPIKDVDITGLKKSLGFKDSASWYNAFSADAEYIVEMYGDDDLIYTSPTIIGNNVNTKFNVNIENVDTLTIKVYNPTPVKRNNNDKTGFIALTDLILD